MVSHQSLTVLLTPGCQRIICCNLSGLHNLTSDYPFLIVYSVTDTLPQGCDQLCSWMQCGRGIMIYWTLRERVKHFYSYLTLVTGQWTGSVRSQSGQRQGGHNPELAASMEGSQQDPVSVKVEIRDQHCTEKYSSLAQQPCLWFCCDSSTIYINKPTNPFITLNKHGLPKILTDLTHMTGC